MKKVTVGKHRINIFVSEKAYERLRRMAQHDRNLGSTVERLIMDVSLPAEPSERYRQLEAQRVYLSVLPIAFMRI